MVQTNVKVSVCLTAVKSASNQMCKLSCKKPAAKDSQSLNKIPLQWCWSIKLQNYSQLLLLNMYRESRCLWQNLGQHLLMHCKKNTTFSSKISKYLGLFLFFFKHKSHQDLLDFSETKITWMYCHFAFRSIFLKDALIFVLENMTKLLCKKTILLQCDTATDPL